MIFWLSTFKQTVLFFVIGMSVVLAICLVVADVVKASAQNFALPQRYEVYLSLVIMMSCIYLLGNSLAKDSTPEYFQDKLTSREVLK